MELSIKDLTGMKDVLRALNFRTGRGLIRQQLAAVTFDAFQADVVEKRVRMLSRFDSFTAEFENFAERFCRPAVHG
jgi:hypothetical protein